MRQEVGLTLDEAAPLLDKTRSALGRIEKGETIADVHLVRSAMDVYQVHDPDAVELAREAMRPGWWQAYGVRDREFIALETAAVRSLELALVRLPALLQTEDYMRAVLGSVRPMSEVDDECAVRLIRQQRLINVHAPLELVVLIDESALRKPVGGPEVMRDQLRHLLDQAELDTVTLSVLPDAAGAHAGMRGAFTVLEFEDDADPDVLATRCVTGAIRIERRTEVAQVKDTFDSLDSIGLPPTESIDFIKSARTEF